MLSYDYVLSNVPKPLPFKRTNIRLNGTTDDIISEILATFQISKQQTAKIAKDFKGKTDADTARNIYNFIHTNIRYQEDKAWQDVKTPSRTIADKFGDCKAFSILAGSILYNLGIPFLFRFADYGQNNGDVTHIYIILLSKKGEIPIDATIARANYELPYLKKIDFYADKSDNNMAKIARVGKPKMGFPTINPYLGGDLSVILTEQEKKSGDWVRAITDIFTVVNTGVNTYAQIRDTLNQNINTNPYYQQNNPYMQSGNLGSNINQPKDNTLLYGALAIGAIYLLTQKKGRK
jgi:transglutaminase-like putative cysteine protease